MAAKKCFILIAFMFLLPFVSNSQEKPLSSDDFTPCSNPANPSTGSIKIIDANTLPTRSKLQAFFSLFHSDSGPNSSKGAQSEEEKHKEELQKRKEKMLSLLKTTYAGKQGKNISNRNNVNIKNNSNFTNSMTNDIINFKVNRKKTYKRADPLDIYYVTATDLESHQDIPNLQEAPGLVEGLNSGIVKIEVVPAGNLVKFVYNKGLLGKVVREIGSTKILTKMYGYYNDRSASEKSIIKFVRDILKIPLNAENFEKTSALFKEKYGKELYEFTTINDIFARKLTEEGLQKILEQVGYQEGDIISNSTARIRIIPQVSIDETFHLTDKKIGGQNNQFSVKRLLGVTETDASNGNVKPNSTQTMLKELQNLDKQADSLLKNQEAPEAKKRELIARINKLTDPIILRLLARKVEGSTMVVNRLAPEDYHHIHFPFAQGKIIGRPELANYLTTLLFETPALSLRPRLKKLSELALELLKKTASWQSENDPAIHIDGQLLSVSTLATTAETLKFNPLTENVRDIVFIENPSLGLVPLIIVGATGVGKNVINLKVGQELQIGENMAHFEFGASTTVMFLPQDKIETNNLSQKMINLNFAVPLTGPERLANLKAVKDGKEIPHPPVIRQMETLVEMGQPLFKIK